VIDLVGGKGFILIGGRLDYLDARPVATARLQAGVRISLTFSWLKDRAQTNKRRWGPQLQASNIWR